MLTLHRAVIAGKIIIGIVFALVLWGLQVTPEDTASHAAAWLHRFGLSDLPIWLTKEQTDQYLTWITAVLLLMTLVWIFWPLFARRNPSHREPIPAGAFHFPTASSDATTGIWIDNKFVCNSPMHVFSTVVTAKDNERLQVFEVPHAAPESLVDTNITHRSATKATNLLT